jgi:hypothetical protein
MEGSRIPGLEGGVRGEVAGGVLLGGPEDAGAPLLVAALGRSPGWPRRRRHLLASSLARIRGNPPPAWPGLWWWLAGEDDEDARGLVGLGWAGLLHILVFSPIYIYITSQPSFGFQPK